MIRCTAQSPIFSMARLKLSYSLFVPSKTQSFNCNGGTQQFPEIPLARPLSLRIAGGRRNSRMTVTMRDKGMNRKQLQKGRNLSIEAIQTVQALKLVKKKNKDGELPLPQVEQVMASKVRRLLKLDMMAVLRELLRQNECLLALKVFEEVRKECWYKPQALLYADIISVLGSNGLLEEVELLFLDFKMEKSIERNTEAFNALLKSLMRLKLTKLATECFYLMKLLGCDPDKSSFRILINCLESEGETDLSATIRQEAEKCYGMYLNVLEDEEEMTLSKN